MDTRNSTQRARYTRLNMADIIPRCESVTAMNKRQYESLKESIKAFGQLQPLVVQYIITEKKYEVVDGNVRLQIFNELKYLSADVLDLGAIAPEDAAELHLTFNLNRGKPKAEPLVNTLEYATCDDVVRQARVHKQIPIAGKSVGQAIEKIRKKLEGKKEVKHNPDAEPSFIDFRMRLPPDAAKICDQALTYIEKNNEVKRSRAFELMAADFLAGAGVQV